MVALVSFTARIFLSSIDKTVYIAWHYRASCYSPDEYCAFLPDSACRLHQQEREKQKGVNASMSIQTYIYIFLMCLLSQRFLCATRPAFSTALQQINDGNNIAFNYL